MGRAWRNWIGVQWLIGWMPVVALFAVVMMTVHGMPLTAALQAALRQIASVALLGLLVHHLAARLPWPHPFQLRFVLLHTFAATLFAGAWMMANSVLESLLVGRMVLVVGPGLGVYLLTGVWFYLMIAGIAYGQRAAARHAQLQALQAQSHLAVLRAQLQPHFLFNALHTVVQLIPIDPAGAGRAAEQLADLLRTSLESPSDLHTVRDECKLVQRYLAIESIRFGDRLIAHADCEPATQDALLPSFALQTLVENAVRHGAAPRVGATTLWVHARIEGDQLRVSVSDDGVGAEPAALETGGTGLRRLRERLGWLYGGSATLSLHTAPGQGLQAELRLPLRLPLGLPLRRQAAV